MFKRVMLTMAVLLVLFVPFVAFGGGEPEPVQQESFEGLTLDYLSSSNPYIETGLKIWVDEFEAKTGMKVVFDTFPESAFREKLNIYMASQDGSYDVINGNLRDYPSIVEAEWAIPVGEFLYDPAYTEASYDPDDILALRKFTDDQGRVWAIGWHDTGNILMYNRAMYAEAGIGGPPKNFDELYDFAGKIHRPEDDQYGIVLRATRSGGANGFSWTMMWLANGGGWFEEGRRPYATLDTEVAIQTTQYWSDILNNYGPPGVSSYHWQESQQTMAQGSAGNWIDGALLGARLLDPEFSTSVDDVGYHVIEGVGDRYTVGGGWGLWIPESAPNPGASWEFIKWATSKEMMTRQATENYHASVTRRSVLESAEYRSLFNDEFVAANIKALSHSEREYSPLIPEGTQIRDFLSIALQEVLTGQATAEVAMKRANDRIIELLEESGYYDSLE